MFKNFLPILCVLLFVFFSLPTEASAKIWINEFYSSGSDDWIELYNDAAEIVILDVYSFRDSSATNKLDLSGQIEPGGYVAFEWGSKLNNSKDIIKLVSKADEANIHDEIAYGSSENLPAPQTGQSAGRQNNGGSAWVVFQNPSKSATNTNSILAPIPTAIPENTPTPVKEPTPTRTPTPTKIPTPTKLPTPKPSTVKIEGESSVKKIKSPQISAKLPQISSIPTAILGVSSRSATTKLKATLSQKPKETVMVKSAVAPPYLILVSGTVFCIACGILVVIKKRKML